MSRGRAGLLQNFYSFSVAHSVLLLQHIQWLCQALTPDSIPLKHSQCPLPCLIGPCVQPWDFLSMLLVNRGVLLQRPDRHTSCMWHSVVLTQAI